MKRLKLSNWKATLTLAVALLILLAYSEFAHYYNYGHLFSYGLHIDVLKQESNIGILGQRNTYRAELSNFMLWPVKLTACEYNTDVEDFTGIDYPYAVQRWGSASNTWQTITGEDPESFCYPVPLGRSQTHIASKRLWPGMSVDVMGWEATGARVPFQKGDMARFVVFTRIDKEKAWQAAIPSAPFYIEDEVIRHEGDSYRVQH
ncbi:MAG: hypothetical protein U0Z53_01425 [Blastocatellia bacterium]